MCLTTTTAGINRFLLTRVKKRRMRSQGFLTCLLVLLSSTAILIFLLFGAEDSIPSAVQQIVHQGHQTPDLHPRISATFTHAAVSSDAVPCASVATDVLKRMQGSAVDAAIAALFCMGLVSHES